MKVISCQDSSLQFLFDFIMANILLDFEPAELPPTSLTNPYAFAVDVKRPCKGLQIFSSGV